MCHWGRFEVSCQILARWNHDCIVAYANALMAVAITYLVMHFSIARNDNNISDSGVHAIGRESARMTQRVMDASG